MPFIVSYLLKLSISLTAVWCVYWFLLRHLTFYTWNRYFLLIYSVLAFFIPFIDIASLLQQHEMNGTTVMSSIPPLFVQDHAAIAGSSKTDYWLLALYVFAAGMIWMLGRLLIQYISLYRIRKRATLLHADGLKLYHVNEQIMPFSFGDSIYVNQHLHQQGELREIIHHEFIHVKQKHSVDIVFGELLCMLNWYNPFAWLLRNAIRQNLEFIADSAVLSNGMDKKAYQYLLLKVTGATQFSIANNFNFSSLKKRIAMMNKQKSAKVNLIRFLFMLPVISIVVLAFRGQGDQGKESFRYTYITDTVPTPPNPPVPPKAPSLPEGVQRLLIKDGKATVKLKNGKTEYFDLTTDEGKAAYESKYGEVIEAPEPPRVVAVTVPGQRIPPMVVHPGIQKDFRDFLRRNDNVENVQWTGDPLKMVITLDNGKQEVYNTEDKEEMKKAEAKYGKLPVPPPPPPAPPAPPAPPRPAKGVRLDDGSAMVVDVTDEPVVAQGYRAAAREMAVISTPVTAQGVAQQPVVVTGYRASTRSVVVAGQAAPSETRIVETPVRGYYKKPGEVVVASGRPSAKRVNGTVSSEIMADEIIIQPDGQVQAGKFDIQMLAKFTESSTQEDIDQISANLQEQGYKFVVEKADFEDGKLVRLRATISKGKDKSSFDASDFRMLVISIQSKNGKSGIHVYINNGKITV